MIWRALVITHIFATFAMTGVGLLVHIVHYPLFRYVRPEVFTEFHRAHATRITWIVGPLMLAELGSAGVLALMYQGRFWWGCLALSVLCFALTGALAVPQHNVLGRGWALGAHGRLVSTNIWRTLAWAVHSGVLCVWLLEALIAGLGSTQANLWGFLRLGSP